MRVAFIAAECEPWAKTGGLGDVVDALARALGRLPDGPEAPVDVYLPRYRTVSVPEERVVGRCSVTVFDPRAGGAATELGIVDVAADGYRLRLIDHPPAFDRPAIYGEAGDYPDNPWRFNLLCLAALATIDASGGIDVLHIHDWHGGPVGLQRDALSPIVPWLASAALVLTCHNLAYHGVVPREQIGDLGPLPPGVAGWDDVDLLHEGIRRSEMVNTVSPTFAKEALTEAFGRAIQELLTSKGDRFVGILNGIDMALWNPAADDAIAAPYSAGDLSGRAACRRDLLLRVGFDPLDEGLVVGMVGRLDPQKGFDLAADAAPRLIEQGIRLVVQGSGDPAIASRLATLAAARPDRVAFIERFDRLMARRIYAGADAFLMPSRFEPSGQAQMIALRYGAPPVVRLTGGLVDTVLDADTEPVAGNGFAFPDPTPEALAEAVGRALRARGDARRWAAIQARGMAQDWSWESGPAPRYVDLYRRAIALRRGL
ncbi:MAG: glycogen synthase [Chloroflexi bacterium]|nr:glycogen synthase [Chloroflexota bacterium]